MYDGPTTFVDEESLQKGEEIQDSLLNGLHKKEKEEEHNLPDQVLAGFHLLEEVH